MGAQGRSWDTDTLEAKAQDFAATYVRVLVPGLSYTATQLAVFVSAFAAVWGGLAASGVGYAGLVDLASGVAPLQHLLAQVDPAWGNTALALVLLELLSPLLIGASLALTPKTMGALRGQLEAWELDEVGMRQKVSEMLK